jgi:flagellar protein FliS
MPANPYQRYRQVTVETASVAELMVLLYRRAIQVLDEAEEAIHSRDVPRAHARLVFAQEIVAELMASLNLEAGELAQQLLAGLRLSPATTGRGECAQGPGYRG